MIFCLWLMGPTSSGKTTLAEALLCEMRENHYPVLHYDGDEVRDIFGQSLSFEKKDRLKVVKTLVHFANKTTEAGVYVIVSALTANQDARLYVSKNVSHLIVGYVLCGVPTCMQRDPKGLYKKAKNGEIDTLIGYSSRYLPPDNYDILINSETLNVKRSVEVIKQYFFKEKGLDLNRNFNI